MYDYPYWYIIGGTSVATPVWAGILNSAARFPSSSGGELTTMYATLGTTAYSSDFNDITIGTCSPNQGYIAGPGWGFCTGLGSSSGTSGK